MKGILMTLKMNLKKLNKISKASSNNLLKNVIQI
jgi:hypothetical protein